ncbi:MAG: type II toxin-antitoxin system VapC family toxin [Deltaproteobacteria bacterium]|nr:type II toxin-antitoxin system VapC family toxin [Deltaproteobacteria bacterium]
MILVDANVLMYAAGAPHRLKRPSADLLDRIARGEVDAVIDAEILQEILRRYRAIDRWKDGRRLYDLARALFPAVLPVTAEVLDAARHLLDDRPEASARDAVHAAACRVYGAEAICSWDKDFDRFPGLKRVEPDEVA